ncbi:Protein kinase domain - like 10 [Theobroma cacao]|nr:Protein kinase domain - like 10 [Theobroma cacao]
MKMVQNGFVGEEETVSSGGGTVVVGVKLDSPSRELLTWALVKVAQPGDSVIALHVLGNNEIVDRDGKSSLLSLVKAFDSVLAVYEGFCNLKQVDLKLKICRGSSIRKILVREAKSYSATKLIVGTAAKLHKIRSSTSVAKYCAKKLTKNCSVLAVHNGKVLFQREGSPAGTFGSQGSEDHKRNSLLNAIQRTMTLNKNSRVLSEGNANAETNLNSDETNDKNLEQALSKARSGSLESDPKKNCSICGSGNKLLLHNSCHQSAKESSADDANDGNQSLAIVPVQKAEATSSSISMLIKQLPEIRPGWPLLRRAVLSDLQQQVPDRSSLRQISVVQWVMRLPSRRTLFLANSDQKQEGCTQSEYKSSSFDGESGAIVPVGTENVIAPPSPDQNSRNLPKELEGLHEKYSATCRLFKYQELVSATSNFLAENFIGKGGSSQVYRGCLRDGKELAVKILKPSEDVLKEFVLEIEILTTLHHKNIISLLGFCYEDDNLLLVYDLLSRGSLEENLHDFGLAKWVSASSSHITCTDAKPILSGGKVSQLLDPSLGDGYDRDQMERMVLAATLCIRRAPRARPQMSVVWKLLQGDADVTKWARLQVNASAGSDALDGEACPRSNLQSHLSLALLDVEDDSLSVSSIEQSVSLEDYLNGRWSRSSSFD